MTSQITSVVVALTLACGTVASAQQVSAGPQHTAPMSTETQPLRTVARAVGAESTHLLTRRPPRGPVSGRKCLRSIGIATAIIGGLAGAAFASEAKEEDKWKVAGIAALRVGIPAGVAAGLAVCLP
jgi:hypothetical protein